MERALLSLSGECEQCIINTGLITMPAPSTVPNLAKRFGW
jgi:hypothetical protein